MSPAVSAGLWSVIRLSPCVARVATLSLSGTMGNLGQGETKLSRARHLR
jgi:hypothetical protein